MGYISSVASDCGGSFWAEKETNQGRPGSVVGPGAWFEGKRAVRASRAPSRAGRHEKFMRSCGKRG